MKLQTQKSFRCNMDVSALRRFYWLVGIFALILEKRTLMLDLTVMIAVAVLLLRRRCCCCCCYSTCGVLNPAWDLSHE